MGMHYFVISRLFYYFNIPSGRMVWLVTVCLGLLFPLSTIIEKLANNSLTRILYVIASILMGFIVFLLGLVIIYEIVRFVYPAHSQRAGLLLLGIAAVTALVGILMGTHFRVKEITIPMPGLRLPVDIVQLSDIHIGTIHRSGFLEKIVSTVNGINPELVLITGDFFDGSAPVEEATIQPLDGFRMPVLFTMGNHERYEGFDNVHRVFSGSKVRILRNEVIKMGSLQIVGIDHPARDSQKDLPILHDLNIDRDLPTILMYHPPMGIQDAQKAGVDLQLSGHTHYGQIFPFSLLVKLVYKHGFGLYQFGEMWLYTSPGTGTWGPPMRIGSRSEVTLIHLVVPETVVAG